MEPPGAEAAELGMPGASQKQEELESSPRHLLMAAGGTLVFQCRDCVVQRSSMLCRYTNVDNGQPSLETGFVFCILKATNWI